MMYKPSSEEMTEKRNTRANESPSLSKKVLISTKLLSILNHVLYISAYFNLFASLISFLNRVFKLFTNLTLFFFLIYRLKVVMLQLHNLLKNGF